MNKISETKVITYFIIKKIMNEFSKTFHWYFFENGKKQVRATKFLEEMEKVIPWYKFLKRIDKHYDINETKLWRPKFESKLMLKIYLLQQWYNLWDPTVEDAIYDRLSFQKFLWLDVGKKWSVPDETTIMNFRHMLEENKLQEKFFEIVKEEMEKNWYILNEWTSVDASLIKAPSSTKNKEGKRDPEMSSTKKNGSYYFWMKIHIWADHKSWMVHTLHTTTAKVSDVSETKKLLQWNEKYVFWDKWYRSQDYKKECRRKGVYYWILDQKTKYHDLSTKQIKRNKQKTDVRKKIEFNFWIVKHLWWHSKVRYKWLEKNTKQFFALFALSNLYKFNQLKKKSLA